MAVLNDFCKVSVATWFLTVIPCCAPNVQPGLNSPHAYERIRAIVKAGTDQNTEAVPLLIDLLDDDDDAVRVYAILALERITSTRMGYNYADPPWERARAIQRWRRWLEADRVGESGAIYTSAEPDTKAPGS